MGRKIFLLSLVLISVVLVSGCIKSDEVSKQPATQMPIKTQVTSLSMPDLIITEATWTPENPKEGDVVKFSVKIKNSGTSTAALSKAQIFNGKILVGSFSILGLESGQEQAIEESFIWTMSDKGNSIRILADSYQEVAESNENNNQWSSTR